MKKPVLKLCLLWRSIRVWKKYRPVILDGTGLFHFKEKHCENCLVRTVTDEDGKKHRDCYHKVLEAKILLSDPVVISLGTEFIENEKEDVFWISRRTTKHME